jgi:hypothetical protein
LTPCPGTPAKYVIRFRPEELVPMLCVGMPSATLCVVLFEPGLEVRDSDFEEDAPGWLGSVDLQNRE